MNSGIKAENFEGGKGKGDPEAVSDCPDIWTLTIELDEVFYPKSLVIFLVIGLCGTVSAAGMIIARLIQSQ
jgi:hypothetical protein